MDFESVERPVVKPRNPYRHGILAALVATAATGRAIRVPGAITGGYYTELRKRGLRVRQMKRDGATIAWCERIDESAP